MKKTLFCRLLTVALIMAVTVCAMPAPVGVSAAPEAVAYEITDADKAWYDAGASELTVSTKGELAYLVEVAKTNNFAGKTIKLGADIVWNDGAASQFGFTLYTGTAVTDWTPIGPSASNPFQGTFDGQGHKISGIVIVSSWQNRGLFGVIKNNTIKNLTVENCYFELSKGEESYPSWAGVIASQSWGNTEMSGITVRDCYIMGDTDNSEYLGGILGCAASASGVNVYRNCSFSGVLRGRDAVGGLIGLVRNKKTVSVENCVVSAEISASEDCGGIIGRLCGCCELKNTHFFGTVTSNVPEKAAALAFLEKKDQSGAAAVDFSTTVFSNCYTVSDISPVAIAAGDNNYSAEVSYAGSETKSYTCLGTADDVTAINSMFAPLPNAGGTSAGVSLASAQNYSADGKCYARLVAGVKDLGSAKYAGFNIGILGSSGCMEVGDLYCTQVFSTLEAAGDAPQISASSINAGQLFALSFRGIPAEGAAIFVVSPFTAQNVSSKTYGNTVVAVYINGVSAFVASYR